MAKAFKSDRMLAMEGRSIPTRSAKSKATLLWLGLLALLMVYPSLVGLENLKALVTSPSATATMFYGALAVGSLAQLVTLYGVIRTFTTHRVPRRVMSTTLTALAIWLTVAYLIGMPFDVSVVASGSLFVSTLYIALVAGAIPFIVIGMVVLAMGMLN